MPAVHKISKNRRLVVLALVAVIVTVLAAMAAGSPSAVHTQSPVTMTPPPTWTGGVPTADWTPNPDLGPDISVSDWNATSTLQPSGAGGTPTPPPTP